MQPDLEQQDENAKLGKRVNDRVIRIDEPENGPAKYHARDQLADDGRLPDSLCKNAEEFRDDEERHERYEQVRERVFSHVVPLGGKLP
jgi:hypothetical protein